MRKLLGGVVCNAMIMIEVGAVIMYTGVANYNFAFLSSENWLIQLPEKQVIIWVGKLIVPVS